MSLRQMDKGHNIKGYKVPLRVKRVHPDAKIPTKAYQGDAGIDLYSVEDKIISAQSQVEVRTGIAIEIPEGWQIQLHTRSSYGKRQLRCHLGIIDAGYRNEITVWVFNHQYRKHLHEVSMGMRSDRTLPYEIKKGDKICQMIVLPVPEIEIKEVDKLSDSERGMKGHGSSGR